MRPVKLPAAGLSPKAPSALSIVRRGVIAGVVGSIVVAALQGAADLVLGEPIFHTPGVLGLGMAGLPGVVFSAGDLFRFTAVHVLVFVVVGVLLALAAGGAQRDRAYLGATAFVFLGVFFGSATMAEAWDPYHQALPNWSIVLCNVVALAVIGWLLRPTSDRGP